MSEEKKVYEVEFGTWFSIPLYVLARSETEAIEAAKKTFELGYTTPQQQDADWLNDWEQYSHIDISGEYPADYEPDLLFDADEFLGVEK